jgi:hypothetical protein
MSPPHAQQGVLSNKVMLLWAALAVVVLAVGTLLYRHHCQITSLTAIDWVLGRRVAFLAALV